MSDGYARSATTSAGSEEADLPVWDGRLGRDVDERLCNEARLVGFDQRVAGDDGRWLCDLDQHVNSLQGGLHPHCAAHPHAANLQQRHTS